MQDTIPAISAPLPAPSSPEQDSPLPHLFEVHPDFGMPANFCLSPRDVPPTPPPTPPFNPFASPAAQQLPASPGGLRSHELSRCGTPVQELTDRLESLAHAPPQVGLLPTLHLSCWASHLHQQQLFYPCFGAAASVPCNPVQGCIRNRSCHDTTAAALLKCMGQG